MPKNAVQPEPPAPEGFLSLEQAAALLPVPPHPNTLHRWIVNGVKVNGVALKLVATRVGKRYWVKRSDLAAFQVAINGQ